MLFLARGFLWLTGWRAEGQKPDASHYVVIAAPHTSNWDFVYMLAIAKVLGVKPNWVGKHTLFKPPFGRVMRKLGGIAVNRMTPGSVAKKIVQSFETKPELALVIPPEGTRSFRPYWKSGFYRIAESAGVPIVMAYVDYERKVGGLGPSFRPTGNMAEDMEIVRQFYADIKGRYPDQFGTPVLRERTAIPTETTED